MGDEEPAQKAHLDTVSESVVDAPSSSSDDDSGAKAHVDEGPTELEYTGDDGYVVLDHEALREIDKVVPGAAKLIVENVMAEAAHARSLEEKEADRREYIEHRFHIREEQLNSYRNRGQIVTGVIMLGGLIVAAYGMSLGFAPASFVLVLLAASILAGTLIGKNSKEVKKEIGELRAMMHQLRSGETSQDPDQADNSLALPSKVQEESKE
ncbi:MAG: DUF2335 domain-containing protein [Myxococcota bacterium]